MSIFAYERMFPTNIPVYVLDISESARVNFFCFYKIFHNFEMDNVGEREPQRDCYFLFPSVEKLFERKKDTN